MKGIWEEEVTQRAWQNGKIGRVVIVFMGSLVVPGLLHQVQLEDIFTGLSWQGEFAFRVRNIGSRTT